MARTHGQDTWARCRREACGVERQKEYAQHAECAAEGKYRAKPAQQSTRGQKDVADSTFEAAGLCTFFVKNMLGECEAPQAPGARLTRGHACSGKNSRSRKATR